MIKIETGVKNSILRSICEKIKKDEIQKYVKIGQDMIKYIKNPDNNGVGLARPQIGVNKRLIVVSLLRDYEDKNYKTIMMINPEILDHSSDTLVDSEGCLSVPGKKGDVDRYAQIKLKYLDNKGQEINVILKGLRARIVQHELDHLDGILFVDRIKKKA